MDPSGDETTRVRLPEIPADRHVDPGERPPREPNQLGVTIGRLSAIPWSDLNLGQQVRQLANVLGPSAAGLFETRQSLVPIREWLDVSALVAVVQQAEQPSAPARAAMGELLAALATYAQPGFAFLPPAKKTATIEALARVARPEGVGALKRLHLPRTLYGDKGVPGTVLRYSVEQEGSSGTIYQWYGPPHDRLAPDHLRGVFLHKLFPTYVKGQLAPPMGWASLSTSERRAWVTEHLDWSMLNGNGRAEYLRRSSHEPLTAEELTGELLSGLFMDGHGWAEPRLKCPDGWWETFSEADRRQWAQSHLKWKHLDASGRKLLRMGYIGQLVRRPNAPAHLVDELQWETPPSIWEVMTRESYASLDQPFAAMEKISHLTGKAAFHVHVTFVPSDGLGQADSRRFAGLLQLMDLSVWLANAPRVRRPFSHQHLKVFSQQMLENAARVFATGEKIEGSLKGVQVGLRGCKKSSTPYNSKETIGFEVRGVLATKDLDGSMRKVGVIINTLSDALATGTFGDVTLNADSPFAVPETLDQVGASYAARPEIEAAGFSATQMTEFFQHCRYEWRAGRQDEFGRGISAPVLAWTAMLPGLDGTVVAGARAECLERIAAQAARMVKAGWKKATDEAWIAAGKELNDAAREFMATLMSTAGGDMSLESRLQAVQKAADEA